MTHGALEASQWRMKMGGSRDFFAALPKPRSLEYVESAVWAKRPTYSGAVEPVYECGPGCDLRHKDM